ncbi:MAG: zinc ribbon domain-containing protein [Candidatus Methanoplasma sp.]|jgi:TM2 domain-containing membrane protein YozV|nr:zinc ribbon domain-containing protein [Candidatus Methanoplasma sp.]
MFCQKCGKEIDASVAFCPGCGASNNAGGAAYSPAPDSGQGQSQGYNPGYTPGYNPGYGGPAPGYVIPEKNSGIAIILAFFIIGLGHIYLGKTQDGIVLLIFAIILSAISYFLFWPIGVVSFVLWIWNLYDAYKKTEEYNSHLRRTGNPPW